MVTGSTLKYTSPRGESYIETKLEAKKAAGKRGFTATQNFEELKKEYLTAGKLFEDPEFPADNESIGIADVAKRNFIWKRPKVLEILASIIETNVHI